MATEEISFEKLTADDGQQRQTETDAYLYYKLINEPSAQVS